MTRVDDLLSELHEERDRFAAAVASVDLELVTVPGVLDGWSVRDLVVHVAFWSEHGAEAVALAASGRGAEFLYHGGETDAINARLLDEARSIAPAAAAEQEERAFASLASALAGLDPALLDLRLGNGDTVEEVVRYDGPDHYREHAEHLRAWFGDEPVEGDDGE